MIMKLGLFQSILKRAWWGGCAILHYSMRLENEHISEVMRTGSVLFGYVEKKHFEVEGRDSEEGPRKQKT